MTVVWYRFRSELRARWRGWLALAVLVGLFGGVVLAAAAGARRTGTAYDRFLAESRAADLSLHGDLDLPQRLASILDAEAVASAGRFFANPVDENGKMDLGAGQPIAPVDAAFGRTVERPNLLDGRLPRTDRADEAFASQAFADRNHLKVGSPITVRFFFADDPDISPDEFDVTNLPPDLGTSVTFTVTGIGVFAKDVVPTHEAEWATGLVLSPAFFAQHADSAVAVSHHVRLKPGTDFDALNHKLEEALFADPEHGFAVEPQAPLHAAVARAIRPQAQALAIFALLAGAAGLAVIGQTLARQLALEATEAPTLRAMGVTPRQLFTLAMLRIGALMVVGGVLAVVLAVATSPWMPIGPARLAETSRGVAVNVALLAAGFAVLVLVFLARAALPAWRAASSTGGGFLGTADQRGGTRRSRLADAVAGSGLPVGAAAGVRMALEPGHGRTAVPVRSTLAATILAIAASAAALTLGANLGHFVATPSLWGRAWDVTFDGHATPVLHDPGVERLSASREVTAFAAGNVGDITVEGRAVTALGFEQIKGDVFPTLLDGRRPDGPGEIVLGTNVLRDIHRSVGDRVTAGFAGDERDMRIVGRAVFPAIGGFLGEPTGLGTGAVVDPSLLTIFQDSPDEPFNFFALRTRSGTTTPALERDVLSPGGPCPYSCYFRPARPADIANFDRMRSTPVALAGILLLVAVGTLIHTLITSVRHRRRDLAVLKTMGFVKGQVSAAMAWQATTIVVLSLVIALPLGVAAGRWGWALLADALGAGTSAVTPVLVVLLSIPAALVLANLVAAVPARAAARTRPALILRSE